MVKEFHYEPNLLSEQLVRLQKFIHTHHTTIEHYIDRTIDGIFFVERQGFRAFRWLREDAPRLVWPTIQVATMATATHFTHRNQPLTKRIFPITAITLMMGFLVYPTWRRESSKLLTRYVIEPVPAVGYAISAIQSGHNHTVNSIISSWNAYDRFIENGRLQISKTRQLVVNFFWPSQRPK